MFKNIIGKEVPLVLPAWLPTPSDIPTSALNLDIINLTLDLLIWNYDGSVVYLRASRINRCGELQHSHDYWRLFKY
jgi:hypothetical protein